MKHSKLSILAFGLLAVAATLFTSCLSDNDEPTYPDPHGAKSQLASAYTGKLIFQTTQKNNGTYNIDSVDCSVEFNNDTTLTLHDFPLHAIAYALPDGSLKNQFMTMTSDDVRVNLFYYSLTPNFVFYTAPQTLTYYWFYDNEPHTVRVVFYQYVYTYTQGTKSNTVRFNFFISVAAVYVDGEPVAGFNNGQPRPFQFVASN